MNQLGSSALNTPGALLTAMVRSADAQVFHKQLLKAAADKLRAMGLDPIQHAPIEGGGRPDLAGRDASGRFAAVVECLVREPTEKELQALRAKYKGRTLILAIPAGMPLISSRKYYNEVIRVVLRKGGKIVLPVREIEEAESRLNMGVLEDLVSSDPKRFRRGLNSMLRSGLDESS